MKRMNVLLVLTIGLAAAGCRRMGSDDAALSGTLEMTEYDLGFRVPGRLVTLAVDESDPVKKGQVLATLDHFDQAQKDYDRAYKLWKNGGTTQQAVEEAELARDDQRIVSPVDGVVLVKVHEVGEIVSAGAAILNVGENKRLWVRVFVPEGAISRVRMNQPATLMFDGLDKSLKGHVSYISNKAEFTPRNVQTTEERVNQTFAVKVALDEADANLRPGVSADVTLAEK